MSTCHNYKLACAIAIDLVAYPTVKSQMFSRLFAPLRKCMHVYITITCVSLYSLTNAISDVQRKLIVQEYSDGNRKYVQSPSHL